MPHTIAAMVRSWSRDYDPTDHPTSPKYLKIESQIDYLSQRLYNEYEITKYPPYLDFPYRLRDWLNSAPTEEDQKVLFQLVPRIFFAGVKEYISLYRSAFNGPIARWLIEELDLQLDDPEMETKLADGIKSTWFCAITDSMQIARFYHVNQIEGVNFRPDWRVLNKFADPTKIEEYMSKRVPPLSRIVLLEDFIGTGSQMRKAVEFAASLTKRYPVLLCPLIVAPAGYDVCQDLARTYSNVHFSPVLPFDDSIVIYKTAQPDEEPYMRQLRETVNRLHPLVNGSNPHHLYGPFGFNEDIQKGGLIFVMYTNCPDNTLPVIHHSSDGPWKALFPRSSRS